MTNIKIKLANGWQNATDYQKEAFLNFKGSRNMERPYHYNQNGYVFTIKREANNGIYLIRENNSKSPIVDWNDVKVFLLDQVTINWYNARSYQTWAYFDFLYSNDIERYYKTLGSTLLLSQEYITIPNDQLPPNIIFRISKNENGTVFYEKNDVGRTRVRISDNNVERNGYLGFYNRMTMDIPMEFISSVAAISTNLSIPTVIITTTLNDNEMCAVCNNNKQNVKFIPCNHTNTCSVCSSEILRLNGPHHFNCPICRTQITKVEKLSWFHDALGFEEKNYINTKLELKRLYEEGELKQINGIDVGKFKLVNIITLLEVLPNRMNDGIVQIENIIGDIKLIHSNAYLSDGSTIQVASQLNCLEMIEPGISPEDGITRYINDKTQGPLCVMTTPAGIAYRNYLYKDGQSKLNQIDMSSDLLKYLKTKNSSINWIIKNGYLIINNQNVLKMINSVLTSSEQIKNEARNTILIGMHTNLGVYMNNKLYDHKVNHVLCSGLPITYNDLTIEMDLWDCLSELFLEAYYEMTLLIACRNNMKSKQNKPCYLTKVGGGVFGMKDIHIVNAINRAKNIIINRGYSLDIKIVHYGSISNIYTRIDP